MQYDFTLAAGAAQSFDVVGKFIKYQHGTGMIRVRMSMGEYVDLLPGQGVFSVDYTRFTVTDRSGANNVGALLAGDFDFRDSRISGAVEVNDVIGPNCKYYSAGGGTNSVGAVQVIVTPAQNTGGILIRQFKLYGNAANVTASDYSTTSLFSSVDSVVEYGVSKVGTTLLGSVTAAGMNAVAAQDVSNMSRRLPVGWGLYGHCRSGANGGAYRVDVSFELL